MSTDILKNDFFADLAAASERRKVASQQQSISHFSKMLAAENISVAFDANAKTASYIPARKTVVLPTYGGSVSVDVLLGMSIHEVYHHIETGVEYDRMTENFLDRETGERSKGTIPVGLMNVLEDIRIEKLAKERFPGAGKFLYNAYRELITEHNFFGTAGNKDPFDFSGFNFLNRLNCYYKAGPFATPVWYNATEREIVAEIEEMRTMADLEKIARKIMKIAKDNSGKSDVISLPPDANVEHAPEDFDPSDVERFSLPDDDEEEDVEEFDTEEDSDTTDTGGEGDAIDEDSDEEDLELGGDCHNEGEESDEEEDIAAPNFEGEGDSDDAEDGLGAGSTAGETLDDLEEDDLENCESYDQAENALSELAGSGPKVTTISDDGFIYGPSNRFNDDNRFETGYYGCANMLENLEEISRPLVTEMVNEFNRKKAAIKRMRPRHRESGKLDVRKMVHYRNNDKIFLKSLKAPEGKNHGVVVLVDLSGSMAYGGRGNYYSRSSGSPINKVIDQLFVLTNFLKKINVPFAVMGWSGNVPAEQKVIFGQESTADHRNNWLSMLVDSSMNSTEIKRRLVSMKAFGGLCGGGTPLFSSLLASTAFIGDFKVKNNLDIVNVLLFTDGQAGDLPTFDAGEQILDLVTGRQHDVDDLLKDADPEAAVFTTNTNENWYYGGYRNELQHKALKVYARILKMRYNVNLTLVYQASKSDLKRFGESTGRDEDRLRVNRTLNSKTSVVTVYEGKDLTYLGVADSHSLTDSDYEIDLEGTSEKNQKAEFIRQLQNKANAALFAKTIAARVATR